MKASIPKLALDLGLDFTDYENIAKNTKRISLVPKDKRQKILDRTNKELPPELRTKVHSLMGNMAYDRQVYRIAKLKYSQGPPIGEDLFTTAIADYLLRHKDKLKF